MPGRPPAFRPVTDADPAVALRCVEAIHRLSHDGDVYDMSVPGAGSRVLATVAHLARLFTEAGYTIEGNEPDVPEEEHVAWAFQHPDFAAAGFSPSDPELVMWSDPAAARRAKAAGGCWWDEDPEHPPGDEWLTAGYSTSEAKVWQKAGVTTDVADRWRAAGYAPSIGARYVTLGIVEPNEAVAWESSGVPLLHGVNQITTFAKWRTAGFTPSEAYAWSKHLHTPKTAAAARAAGHTPKTATRVGPRGIPLAVLDVLTTQAADAGCTLTEPVRCPPRFQRLMTTPGWLLDVHHGSTPIATIVVGKEGRFRQAYPYGDQPGCERRCTFRRDLVGWLDALIDDSARTRAIAP